MSGAGEFSIRRAETGEAAALSELAFRSKAHWGYDDAFMEDCREELSLTADQVRRFHVYAAERDGSRAGFYQLVALQGRYAGMMELEHFWVAPEAMGEGVGRALWAHAVGIAQSAGAHTIEIQSDPHAAGFYRRMGCRDAGEAPSASIRNRRLPVLKYRLGAD